MNGTHGFHCMHCSRIVLSASVLLPVNVGNGLTSLLCWDNIHLILITFFFKNNVTWISHGQENSITINQVKH